MGDRGSPFAARVGSSVLILLGAAVLVGWATGINALTSVLPGLATMKPATATGFLASGASLGLLAFPRGGAGASLMQRGLAVGVALLGTSTVLEYRLSWDGGFDGLFLWHIEGEGPYPARMSEMTAISFLVAGGSLTLAPWRGGWRWTQGLAILLLAISVTALVGYWYGVEALYAIDPFSSMAVHTALGFGVIAVSIVWTSPNQGLAALAHSDSVGGMTLRRYLPAAVVGPLVVGWLQVLGVRLRFFEIEFGTAVVATASTLLLAGLVTGYAWWLDQSETQRSELEAQLHRAQRLESVGRLAGGIAHDFNNVLTIVLTTASLLETDVDDAGAREDLITIQDACGKARSLTRQLLALGSRQVLQPQVVNLNNLLRDNEALVRSLVPESIACTYRPDSGLGNVYVDPAKLEQVLLNLVVNAVDAMPEGGELTLETRNVRLDEAYAEHHLEVEPGSYVVLLVSDTGIGIDSATMESIFEPFFTTKAPGKGTGLGLATAYGILRQSGGRIWVYSEVGLGTTFKIYLPRVDQTAKPIGPRRQHPEDTMKATEFVLVVDDDQRLSRLVSRILDRAGYTVHAAVSGVDALDFAKAHAGPIDLVITDVTMPDMGGRELVERMVESRPEARFLYMSGYADDGLVRLEGDEFLEKPFTPTELLERTRNILRP